MDVSGKPTDNDRWEAAKLLRQADSEEAQIKSFAAALAYHRMYAYEFGLSVGEEKMRMKMLDFLGRGDEA